MPLSVCLSCIYSRWCWGIHCILGWILWPSFDWKQCILPSSPSFYEQTSPSLQHYQIKLSTGRPSTRLMPLSPLLPEIVNGEEEFIVEEILDSRVINRKLHYLVKWEGYRIEHNSWEPADDVHALECVADFHWKHPGAPLLSYDLPWSFWNGKYVENNSGQERTKSGTLPVTDKDLASMYVLCHLSPTCPWFWTERNTSGAKWERKGKLSWDSKLAMTRQVLNV